MRERGKKGCSAAVLAATIAHASGQTFGVNGTGADSFIDIIGQTDATRDALDLDNDGVFGDQLAGPIVDCFPPIDASGQVPFYLQTYRSVGARNGLSEFVDLATTFAFDPDGSVGNGSFQSTAADLALFNTNAYIIAGDGIGPNCFNPNNPGGTPFRTTTEGSFQIVLSPTAPGGVGLDYLVTDAPVAWSIRPADGVPDSPLLGPGQRGYGLGSIPTLTRSGQPVTDDAGAPITTELLATLDPSAAGAALGSLPLNINENNPDSETIFERPLFSRPLGVIVNRGVGMTQINESDLRSLITTGRRLNGENLMVVSLRPQLDSALAFANSVGTDPSFARGERVGDPDEAFDGRLIGPGYQPSNYRGFSDLEAAVINHRLAVGYTPATRGATDGWLFDGRAELLAVRNDLDGGVNFNRPTADAVLNGGENGYAITGYLGIATVGDTLAEPVSNGGENRNTPMLRNPRAAGLINNLFQLTEDPTPGSPIGGAPSFLSGAVPTAAQQFIYERFADSTVNRLQLVTNPDFSTAAFNFVMTDPDNVLNDPRYSFFDSSTAGVVPTRQSGPVYSDGVAGGATYLTQGGQPAIYGEPLAARNFFAGDFNGDTERTPEDTLDLVAAFLDRNGGPAWIAPDGVFGSGAGDDAIVEVLGDFDGDGSFTEQDVRFWGDGLVLRNNGIDVNGDGSFDPTLDRRLGFRLIDEAWESLTGDDNFFSVTISTGEPYSKGAASADLAQPDANISFPSAGRASRPFASRRTGFTITSGFSPNGADGIIDTADADYISTNYGSWLSPEDAASIDLSCDLDGDLIVGPSDLVVLIEDFAGTLAADINLDDLVDECDRDIIIANITTSPAVFSQGDVDLDTDVDIDDLIAFNKLFCTADMDGDGQVNLDDILAYFALFGGDDPTDADRDMDGDEDLDDLLDYFSTFANC